MDSLYEQSLYDQHPGSAPLNSIFLNSLDPGNGQGLEASLLSYEYAFTLTLSVPT